MRVESNRTLQQVCSAFVIPTKKTIEHIWVTVYCEIYRYNAVDFSFIDKHASPFRGFIHSMAYCNGNVWACSNTNKIAIFDADSGELDCLLEAHDGKIHSIITVGDYIWTSSFDKNIIIWDSEKQGGKYCSIDTLCEKHSDSILCLCLVNKNGKYEVWSGSGSLDGTVCIFTTSF